MNAYEQETSEFERRLGLSTLGPDSVARLDRLEAVLLPFILASLSDAEIPRASASRASSVLPLPDEATMSQVIKPYLSPEGRLAMDTKAQLLAADDFYGAGGT